MNNSLHQAPTLLEAVRQGLAQAGLFNSGDSVAPAAIFWTDSDGEWQPIVAKLRALLPELLTLGPFEPEKKIGPAIWMRCVIEGTLPDVRLPEKSVPVIYLPNVSRQTLRSLEECPDDLKPLVELQYRGVVWTQVNGKDWTVEAFLVSENGGLGLDMARDQRTRRAMLGALEALATTPIASLRGHTLEAEDFDKLMVGDTIRDLLLWIGDPAGSKAEWDPARWSAFKSRCSAEYGVDPDSDGEIVAAEKLGSKEGPWAHVWRRFVESPVLYPGLPATLRRAKPTTLLFDREPWPDENEKDEVSLRTDLVGLKKLSPSDACEAIIQLDTKHAERRKWVWARMGLSPLAIALGYLRVLAEIAVSPVAGDTPDAMASMYTKQGFRADDAVLHALAAVRSADDQSAIRDAIRSIYLPWLGETALKFQKTAAKYPLPDSTTLKDNGVVSEPHECILFADGLRYDVAQRLRVRAEERHIGSTDGYRWAAVPTVTPTAKPAVTPIAPDIIGTEAGADFTPVFGSSRQPVNADKLRGAMLVAEYQVLYGLDPGQPQTENARSWTEFGEFDALGHKLQVKLANQIDDQVELLVDRIQHLLEAGWHSVRVVTDHGWLLMPGGLPALPLKKYLAECRWARCAVIKEGAQVDVPVAGWFWDRHQSIAYAPGVDCFISGMEYTHGGLSLQECLIPDMVFTRQGPERSIQVSVDSVQWLGLRCRVVIKPAAEGLSAELRSKPNDPQTRICASKMIDSEGRAGLLVEDDSLAGSATILVVVDASGRVLCKYPTIVGGES